MSPKNGTWSRFRPVLRVKMPPMTAVCPSMTSRSVSASRFKIVGSPRGRRLVEVRLVAVDLHVHRDRAVGGDVRRHEELQLGFLERRLNALRADLRERDQRALVDARVAVVERQDARARHDAHEAARSRPPTGAGLRLKLLSIDPKRDAERTAGSGADGGREVDREVRRRDVSREGRQTGGRRVVVVVAAGRR